MSWIVDEIEARGGSIPFDEFMELALYHREHGYYSSAIPRYGRGGDYLTAPTASEWYPRVFARMLARMARSDGPLRMVDVASGDGSLIAGVLESLAAGANGVLDDVVSVERTEAMRSRQIDRGRHLYVQIDTDGLATPLIPVYQEIIGLDVMSPFEVASGCDVVEIGKQHPGLVTEGPQPRLSGQG